MLLLEATTLTLAGSGIKVAEPRLILPSPSPHLLRAVSPGSSAFGLVGRILAFDPELHCGGAQGDPSLGKHLGGHIWRLFPPIGGPTASKWSSLAHLARPLLRTRSTRTMRGHCPEFLPRLWPCRP